MRGRTPIYIACEQNNFELAKLLIRNNASVFIPNNKGIFPFEILDNDYLKKILDKAKIVSDIF